MADKLSAQQLREGLAQFSGTEKYHRATIGNAMVCTDGVIWLAENAGAYWLIDLVWSYIPRYRKDKMLRDISFWVLKVDLEKKTAVVSCNRDEGDEAFRQKIPYTDFPLPEIKLICELGSIDGTTPVYVLMIPGER